MSKQIAVIVDVERRMVIGASRDNDRGFNVVYLPENSALVVTCEGAFSWRCIEMAQIKEELPPIPPESSKQHSEEPK